MLKLFNGGLQGFNTRNCKKSLKKGIRQEKRRANLSQKSLNPSIWRDGMNIKRGEIYLAALDPVLGKEISKTRPVVIISNNKNNLFSGTVTILPISSQNLDKIYPFEVFLPKESGNLPKNSKVKADQIRTIDKMRIIRLIGELKKNYIEEIERAIKIHLDLPI